ncbi:glycosyltransferase [Agrococcus sp. Ld7]|uniref:glycosyltransferase n=1 Tax=Agrococcus sp. Ld7 TaxID=649148 RepID=UPI0038697110
MTAQLPLLVHFGDPQHGVDRCARALAESVQALRPEIRLARIERASDAPRVHIHFTDRLWGADAESAAAAVEALAADARVAVTVHDVPQRSDGEEGMRRRARAYRRVVEVADVIVCNSEHERSLLQACTGTDAAIDVIPLPSAVPLVRPAAGTPRNEVAVLGFFYPGKGHREVVDAVAVLPEAPAVTAIGRAAPGHEAELAELQDYSAGRGVAFTATGFVPDDALLERAQQVAVPVVAHQHVSASGSLNDWIAAGRRPITVTNAYFREMAALRPGTVRLVEPAGLSDAIAAALEDPAKTWLSDRAQTGPHADDVAIAYLARWSRW